MSPKAANDSITSSPFAMKAAPRNVQSFRVEQRDSTGACPIRQNFKGAGKSDWNKQEKSEMKLNPKSKGFAIQIAEQLLNEQNVRRRLTILFGRIRNLAGDGSFEPVVDFTKVSR